MKNLIKVAGLIALAGAALFAVNAGSALAAPPPPWEDEVIPHIPFDPPVDPGPELDLPSLCEMSDICDLHPLPIDPCVFTDTCGVDDSADDGVDEADSGDEDMVVDPTATPTDEPTATPTDEPTATPTDEPTATPTDEPTTVPTDTPPTVAPQPDDLPTAGSGGIMNDVGGGVVLLAGMSLGAMALAWVLFFASRRRVQTER
jgi:hypothetical protein